MSETKITPFDGERPPPCPGCTSLRARLAEADREREAALAALLPRKTETLLDGIARVMEEMHQVGGDYLVCERERDEARTALAASQGEVERLAPFREAIGTLACLLNLDPDAPHDVADAWRLRLADKWEEDRLKDIEAFSRTYEEHIALKREAASLRERLARLEAELGQLRGGGQ